jgi:hypothetical protein
MRIKKTNAMFSALAIILLSLWLPIRAASPCRKQPIENLVKAFAEAFESKTLGRLDAQKPYSGKLRIVIEHSLADDDDKDRFEIKWFNSFAQAERWFKSRETDGMPGRLTRPPLRCRKGVCTYSLEGGLSHNSLYLKKITYGTRSGCPYIKTIYLLDGD